MHRRAYLTAAFIFTLIAVLWGVRMAQRSQSEATPQAERIDSALPQEAEAQPSETPATPQRDEVGASGAALEGESLAVRVLTSGTFDPIASAELRWWPALDPRQGDTDELVRRLLNSAQARTLLATAGRVTSDANGLAQVPDATHGVLVLASSEGRLGIAQFLRGESQPLEVILQRDFALEARVLDELGAPVEGIDVELRVGDANHSSLQLRERSGADGLARFEHAGFACATWSGGAEFATLAVAEPVEPAAELEFALQEPPQAPVELIVPSGGECEVRVLDAEGRPASGTFDVILGYLPGEDLQLEELDPNWLQGARRSAVENGSAVFRRVQPQRELLATVLRQGRGPAHRAIGTGPVDAKSRAVLEVRLGSGCTLVTGRAVAESGEARVDAALELRVASEGWSEGLPLAASTRSDATGHFQFEVESAQWSQLGELSVQLVELDRERSEIAEGTRRVNASAGERQVALGDVRLVPRRVYASGRVVNSALAPVCGAWVVAARLNEEGAPDEIALETLPNLRARTDALGRFELRVPQGLEALHLLAGKGELRSNLIRASEGVKDLQVVLQPRAELAGRLVVDPTISMARVEVVATRKDVLIGSERLLRTRPELDGRFVLRGVSEGEHSISVHALDGYAELARVDGVFAIAGERTLDARLDPFDLRAGSRTISIALRDATGAPFLGEVSVVVRSASAAGESSLFAPVTQGVASVLVGEKAPLVTVLAPGHLAQVLGAVDGDRLVTLVRAPQLRFTLGEGVELPPLPYRLALQFRPTTAAARDVTRSFPQPEFGGNRMARCEATLAGKLQVTLHLVRRTENAWNEVEVPLEQPLVIDVRERGEQAFEVRCAPAALESALRALGGR